LSPTPFTQDFSAGVGLGQQFAALAVDKARLTVRGLGVARLDASVEAHEIAHVHAAVIGAVGGAGGVEAEQAPHGVVQARKRGLSLITGATVR